MVHKKCDVVPNNQSAGHQHKHIDSSTAYPWILPDSPPTHISTNIKKCGTGIIFVRSFETINPKTSADECSRDGDKWGPREKTRERYDGETRPEKGEVGVHNDSWSRGKNRSFTLLQADPRQNRGFRTCPGPWKNDCSGGERRRRGLHPRIACRNAGRINRPGINTLMARPPAHGPSRIPHPQTSQRI